MDNTDNCAFNLTVSVVKKLLQKHVPDAHKKKKKKKTCSHVSQPV